MSAAAPTQPFVVSEPLPTGTTLLEASAGTGKTWTIAALVTRYVAEGHARLEELLVVTFGRAASQELRERVREQLVVAERALADPAAAPAEGWGEVAELLLAQQDARAERLLRLRQALVDFDSATIATTHQFCQQVLRSLGVAGDTEAGATLVEDLDDLVLEVVDDLYVRVFADEEGAPAFSRDEALAIAREATGDPQARLEPLAAPDDTAAARRRRFGEAVRRELDLRKRRLGVLSYDDLLSQLAEALEREDSPARQRMRERWKVVLVDEFQDTDPVQWQVLDRAFTGVATMVLIGDPKQAIYAFRGGDVTTYLDAAETASTHATLDRSWRSDPALLERLQCFLREAALGDPRIVVRDVRAGRSEQRLVGAPRPDPFRVRVLDREEMGVRRGNPPIATVREHVYRDLALDVRALLDSDATFAGRPLEARDVAVLCETRAQGHRAWEALAEVGVPAVVAGGGSVFATVAATEWLTLLEALEQPHRADRVRAAGLSCFLGRTPEQLDAGGDVETDALAEVLRDWADLLRRRGVAAVFEAVLGTRDLTARALAGQGGERLLTDLRHVAEALHDVSLREHLGLVALVAWTRAQMADDKVAVASERMRRIDSDAAAVQVVTIHGSKGLEWPVVYLPGLADSFPITPSVWLFHDDAGQRCLDVGGTPGLAAHRTRAAEEEAGEDLRLLYVALTRAQSQLVTWWAPSAKNTQASPLHRMLFGRSAGATGLPVDEPVPTDERARAVLEAWQREGGPSVERVSSAPRPPPRGVTPGPALSARRFDREIDTVWRRTSYSALSSGAEAARVNPGAVDPSTGATGAVDPTVSVGSEPESPPRDDETVPDLPDLPDQASLGDQPAGPASPMAGLPVGATFGSLVHAVLELADPAAPEHGGDLRAELLAHVRDQLVRWPVGLDPEELADALVLVCDTPLGPLAPTTLRGLGTRDRMCELDFELPLGGGDLVSGPISRATLRDLAGLLRGHLPADDPLRPFAEVLDDPAYDTQVLRGYLTGSLDLVLRVDGRYLVADYKTNWLGAVAEPGAVERAERTLDVLDYRADALGAAMRHSSYPLQALLYAVVLHRFLRWRVPGYDPEVHLGGVLYLYVRGMAGPSTPVVDGHPCGVFSWRPPTALVAAVSDLLDGADR